MNTQPRWLSATQALASKTMVRVLAVQAHAEGRAPAKAESFAKPFAKHAADVLKAHVDAMCAPLMVLPMEVRRALLPGLFALCEMMSEHSRDTLMVSVVDGDGRTILKALWTEHDKYIM